MNKARKFISLFTLLQLLLLQLSPSVLATELTTTSSPLPELRIIAINALKDFPESESWNDVTILKETPLENPNGEVFAYCFDLKNDATSENAYIILSVNRNDFPVIQFAPNALSAYYNMSSDHDAVYLGAGAYYYETSSNFVSLNNPDVQIDKQLLRAQETSSKSTNDSARSNYSSIRSSYLSTERTVYPRYVCNLTGVPNYQWYLGCVPTSLAMVLHYHYPNINTNHTTTISDLADRMLTTNGWTNYALMHSAVIGLLSSHDLSYHKAEFDTTNALGTPRYGATYNTLVEYKTELDSGYPVVIAMIDAPGTTDAYSNGFGDHAIVGVGYSFSGTFDYIIAHTTAQSDGDVYLTPNSSVLGDYAWFYFHD